MTISNRQRVYNFSPGPSMLPTEVVEQVREDLPTWGDRGYSAMEVSHRSPDFAALLESIETDLRELMQVPDDYSVLLIQGGATLQFSMLPMNVLHPGESADYLTTGSWSKKAFAEASLTGTGVREAVNGKDSNYLAIPPESEWQLDADARYLHYVHNETITGLMFPEIPQVETPLVADLSSCILTANLDISRLSMAYAGVQKNMGPAGLAVVVISPELLESANRKLPEMLSYSAYARNHSLLNTPPTFTCYVLSLMLQWVKSRGGVSAVEAVNRDKAERLYRMIDQSQLYDNPVQRDARSLSNVAFTLADSSLDEQFLEEAERAGLASLRGHRSVGGMRASIYNGMPLEGVLALLDFMQDFEQRWQR